MKSDPSIETDTAADLVATSPAGPRIKLLIALLCLAVIAVGAIGALVLIRSAPKARKQPPLKMTPLVRVQKVYPQTQTVKIQAMGTVVPAQELTLKTRVAGEIVHIHPEFTEGGIVNKGALILKIDDVDYKLITAQKRSAVADARYALKLELGRQDVAQREWKLLNGNNPVPGADAELALRKPHLEKARADLAAAEAALEQALLQLKRTRILAPFNAIIRSSHVERGSQVAVQENLATLVGIDEYWVQASVPVDRLQWIAIPGRLHQRSAQARITYHAGAARTGRVMKLLSDLESEGRMARLVIAVKDPLGLKASDLSRPAMLIGEYVRVEIDGHRIEAAYRLPRTALRDNTHIWIVGPDGKLQIRKVETLWRDSRTILLQQGLQPGDQVIVSDLATPIPGMVVEIEKEPTPPIKPATTTNPKSEKG